MSSTALTNVPEVTVMEQVILNGDLKTLAPAQRLSFYNRVCESLGLNPLTQPFAYLSLTGKMVLYARKDAAEQLRAARNVSCEITNREIMEGVYVVTVKATLPNGRIDSATGAVPIESLKGEARANAMMKAETKAKRRVTLSICGLGMMDETEVESIEGARKVSVDQAHTLIEAGNGGVAGNTAPPTSGGSGTRPVPEELKLCIDAVRKGDYSHVATAGKFLQDECIKLGVEKAYLDRAAGLRASYPRDKPVPTAVMETFLLDLWGIMEAAAMRKDTEAPGDKEGWLPDGLFPEEVAK